MLFCPANRPDRYGKAVARADVVIFDLEDAVAPDNKESARRQLADSLDQYADQAVVRVNAADSPWFVDDVAMLRDVGHQVVMLPKVERPTDLDAVADLEVIAICETAAGVLASPSIAAHDACEALMWGSEDLIADLEGRRSRRDDGRYYPLVEQARSTVRLAASAAGKRTSVAETGR
jgi:citrate lyase subunit beta / citryl-CoA lyase